MWKVKYVNNGGNTLIFRGKSRVFLAWRFSLLKARLLSRKQHMADMAAAWLQNKQLRCDRKSDLVDRFVLLSESS